MAEDARHRSFFFKKQKKSFESCLHPSLTCKRPPIRAHSIQNQRVLELIQQNGHVIMPRYKIKGDNSVLEFERLGRNQASTFTGLCSDRGAVRSIATPEHGEWPPDCSSGETDCGRGRDSRDKSMSELLARAAREDYGLDDDQDLTPPRELGRNR
jgi:hypothetical protein